MTVRTAMSEKAIFLNTSNIQDELTRVRKESKTIGLCHGCFDLVHAGHLMHFKEAKARCDFLVVSITGDAFINKGPGRPLFDEETRLDYLASLREVDAVVIAEGPTALDIIVQVKPDIYFKGVDYKSLDDDPTGMIEKEKAEVERCGGSLVVTETEKYSSTNLIKYGKLQQIGEEGHEFLDRVREETSLDEVIYYIEEEFAKIRLAVFGDLIIDEYISCIPVGTTSKSPTISCIYQDTEVMLGGSAAVSRHIAQFAESVELFTQKGLRNWQYDDLIDRSMPRNINIHWVSSEDLYTPHKVRYLSYGYPNTLGTKSRTLTKDVTPQKLFELAYLNEGVRESNKLLALLKGGGSNIFDNVHGTIWADFGHGLLDEDCWNEIKNRSPFSIVNVQTNSTNYGFNLAGKYENATVACIDELEARLLVRDRDLPVDLLWEKICEVLGLDYLIVTRGSKGLMIGKNSSPRIVPAVATRVVDPVGAGDAVLSAAALCKAANAPSAVTEILSSAFGAIACGIVGNREPVTKIAVKRFIEGWL